VNVDDMHIGRRVRQIRHWRGLSIKVTAELAGISGSYLSLIELGYRPVIKQSTLEALANALRVSPADLTDKPWERIGDQGGAQPTLVRIESALDAYTLGEDHGEPAREWPEVEADVKHLRQLMVAQVDYVAASELVPKILGELHARYVRDPEHRQAILLSLTGCYRSAMYVAKRLGGDSNSMALMAAMAAQRCTEELGSPQWRARAIFDRCIAAGSLNRPQQYRRSVAAADELNPTLDDPEVLQAYGMLHLSAAMAAAAQSDRDTATTHLDEAEAIAGRLDVEVGTFGGMWFGGVNVGVWRVAVGLELGDGARVAEVARGVRVQAIPSPKRQASFFADVGRALLTEKASWDKGLALLLRAEELAPQFVRNDVFVREAVGDVLRMARRDAGGRELRGLAYRLGLAPRG
jgi:transcriptional regulator with XRE-family HTH domain